MKLKCPTVTVLMPVYNAEKYVKAAVTSILKQDFHFFKLVILNDGSTDSTTQIINELSNCDSRIKIIHEMHQKGILHARDRLLREVDTEYFTWMDADDISTEKRLSKQIEFLDENQSIDLVSASWSTLGSNHVNVPYHITEELRAAMLVSNPFLNALMMVRTSSVLPTAFRYQESGVKSASDYAFLEHVNLSINMATIPDLLYLYRKHSNQESVVNRVAQREAIKSISVRQFEKHGVMIPKHLKNSIRSFPGEEIPINKINEVASIYKQLIKSNTENKWYKDTYLRKHLSISLKRMCIPHGINGFFTFIKAFGIIPVLKGKLFGFDFLKRCIKSKSHAQ